MVSVAVLEVKSSLFKDFSFTSESPINGLLNEEIHLGRLPTAPSRPTLVLSDLSGNHKAVLQSLIARRLLSVKNLEGGNCTLELTDSGKNSRLVVLGDSNDRREGFLMVLKTLSALHKLGMEVVILAGNHEAVMLSLLLHRPAKFIPFAEIKLKDSETDRTIKGVEAGFSTWQRGLQHWINKLGGDVTIQEFARGGEIYDRYPDCTGKNYLERLLKFWPGAEEEGGCHIATLYNRAFHGFQNSKLANYFVKNLKPFYFDNGICFCHAALPKLGATNGRDYLHQLNRSFKHQIHDPGECWKLGHGVCYDTDRYTLYEQDSENFDFYYGRVGSLIWDRLPDNIVNAPFDLSLKAEAFDLLWLQQLGEWGVSSMIRGHDTPFRLGAQAQSMVQLGGMQIVNCEAELAIKKFGYTYIDQQGEVFAFSKFS